MKIQSAPVLTAFLLLVASGILFSVFSFNDDFNLARREILMRKIGHEILLHSGDSSSRVLPVTKLGNEKYRIVFEKPFTFEPDTLVAIVRHTLAWQKTDYIVKVLDCSGASVVYGYAISNTKKSDVLACAGRKQPTGCYVITIEFEQPTGIKNYVAAASLLGIVVLLPLAIGRLRRKKTTAIHGLKSDGIAIGPILFNPDEKQLIAGSETVKLTAKENRLLLIFAQNPNQIIDRARLQKEIWEDEGIIVGRSLDVFISKLRKKLGPDPAVQLVNIHGKGYKLQVDQPEI